MGVTFEFLGGFMDGRKVSTETSDPLEAKWAEGHYFLTESGKVGKRFKTLSDAALMSLQMGNVPAGGFTGHIYEVVDRLEEQAVFWFGPSSSVWISRVGSGP
jgi:hypothetical protein